MKKEIQNGQKGYKKRTRTYNAVQSVRVNPGCDSQERGAHPDRPCSPPIIRPDERIKGPSPALTFSRHIAKLNLQINDRGWKGNCQYLSIAHQLQIHGLGDFSFEKVLFDLATWLRGREQYVVADGGALGDIIVTNEFLENGNPNFDGNDWQDFCSVWQLLLCGVSSQSDRCYISA